MRIFIFEETMDGIANILQNKVSSVTIIPTEYYEDLLKAAPEFKIFCAGKVFDNSSILIAPTPSNDK